MTGLKCRCVAVLLDRCDQPMITADISITWDYYENGEF